MQATVGAPPSDPAPPSAQASQGSQAMSWGPSQPTDGFVCSHLCFYFLNELFSVGFLAASCTISCAGKLGLHPHRPQSAREGEPYQTGRLGLPRSPSATHLSPAHGCSPWLLCLSSGLDTASFPGVLHCLADRQTDLCKPRKFSLAFQSFLQPWTSNAFCRSTFEITVGAIMHRAPVLSTHLIDNCLGSSY